MGAEKKELPPIPDRLPVSVVDAHTHLDACGAVTAADVTAMVDRAERAGVSRVITVADDLAAARWAAQASTWDPRVWAAVAIHPTRTKDFGEPEKSEVERLANESRVVAVGETGLDYYWDYSPHDAQQDAFRWHIDLAKRIGKPLMIHDRDAHDDVLRILEEEGAPEQVVFHCFSGDEHIARRCVDAGYVLSFAGTVSFRNARGLHEAARIVPADQYLVETDAPFLTPHPFRGRPNEPYCAAYTVRHLASLRGEAVHEVAESVRTTAERVFGLPTVTTG
ncbi:TatD family hydrolase [Amycolatopsis roodepoortensis]|uniref:TatD DNase family protein n=1 Tax=Amycolatopsis roodepoortensis TaxID=700274 RepID=A0ABR9L679_9PSEU|nr:TatD family hydrolase [Amycolatopsis roodepoortensis]MBE1576219.1 TatD DNase family protein [Amycolatopsis roodepoortensis]RSN09065.1 DNAase [Streptomyces sp. WAC 05977]UUV29173.1 TatD family hydrolase [Amycolatopsis roodepoortensis]